MSLKELIKAKLLLQTVFNPNFRSLFSVYSLYIQYRQIIILIRDELFLLNPTFFLVFVFKVFMGLIKEICFVFSFMLKTSI